MEIRFVLRFILIEYLGGTSGLSSMMRQFQQGGGPGGLGKLFGGDK